MLQLVRNAHVTLIQNAQTFTYGYQLVFEQLGEESESFEPCAHTSPMHYTSYTHALDAAKQWLYLNGLYRQFQFFTVTER